MPDAPLYPVRSRDADVDVVVAAWDTERKLWIGPEDLGPITAHQKILRELEPSELTVAGPALATTKLPLVRVFILVKGCEPWYAPHRWWRTLIENGDTYATANWELLDWMEPYDVAERDRRLLYG